MICEDSSLSIPENICFPDLDEGQLFKTSLDLLQNRTPGYLDAKSMVPRPFPKQV